MVKFFTQLCPKFALRRDGSFMRICPACLSTVRGNLIPYFTQTRTLADKGDSKEPPKEEANKISMPGFTHPETLNEEGFFTEKAKKELETLKKNQDKPTLDKPRKKP